MFICVLSRLRPDLPDTAAQIEASGLRSCALDDVNAYVQERDARADD
jgi:hypothetical protein